MSGCPGKPNGGPVMTLRLADLSIAKKIALACLVPLTGLAIFAGAMVLEARQKASAADEVLAATALAEGASLDDETRSNGLDADTGADVVAEHEESAPAAESPPISPERRTGARQLSDISLRIPLRRPEKCVEGGLSVAGQGPTRSREFWRPRHPGRTSAPYDALFSLAADGLLRRDSARNVRLPTRPADAPFDGV